MGFISQLITEGPHIVEPLDSNLIYLSVNTGKEEKTCGFSPAELLLIYRHFFIFTSVTKQDPESQV
jgi:hypothetical protein